MNEKACLSVPTRIDASIDLTLPGMQVGHLRVPYSSNESAYGWLPLPIASIRGGAGPTLLLLGGVHGDEYEGQIALAKLLQGLAADAICGHLLVLPSTNMPAVRARSRLSPLDKGNLNRAFPGDANGTPTQMIAHYLEEVVLPQCDHVIDLHSGGSSLEYAPCVRARLSADAALARKTLALVEAFDASYGVLFRPSNGEPRTLSAACERKGVVYINPETGGGGRIDRGALQIAEQGIRNCLVHLGMLDGEVTQVAGKRTKMMTLSAADSLIYAEGSGLWEPLVELHDAVRVGQTVAQLHDPDRPWQAPVLVRSKLAGTIVCKRTPTWADLGDCLFEIATEFDPH